MLAVSEALSVILEHAAVLAPRSADVGAAALGCVLAEPIVGDIDSPPYTKALMDGYAVRAADGARPPVTLRVTGEVAAGQVPTKAVGAGDAIRIMTGAPLPDGADCVVPVEQTEAVSDGVRIVGKPLAPGQNLLERGREWRAGEPVLQPGTLLRPQEIGLLASLGRSAVAVHARPRVAILTTGDEVVEASQTPGPGQIRNSNGPMLQAQALRAGAEPRYLGIAGDRVETLSDLVAKGLADADVLVLSGGVSAGKFDLVPDVLRQRGVTAHFHKVALKPGKPLLFGTHGNVLVFGLPGNPVSSFVCFELFIRPALRGLCGEREAGPRRATLPIADAFRSASDRPLYHPGRLEPTGQGWQVRPLPWFGSADLRGVSGADALLAVPPGTHAFRPGDPVPVILLEA